MQAIIDKLLSFDLERLNHDPFYCSRFNGEFWIWIKEVAPGNPYAKLIYEAYDDSEEGLWLDMYDLVAMLRTERIRDVRIEEFICKVERKETFEVLMGPVYMYVEKLEGDELATCRSLLDGLDDIFTVSRIVPKNDIEACGYIHGVILHGDEA